jgi:hypothetical protein|tara:strand:+ start:951 stop:1250 length:300 start_codon:yes stop_codon:yes gene_type:complete
MSNLKILSVIDISKGTTTNLQGDLLLQEISKTLLTEDSLVLSFKDSTPLSSSFLNSSFGELVDQYGKKEVLRKIKVTDLMPSLLSQINTYLKKTSEFAS